jgi:hypothetical protein
MLSMCLDNIKMVGGGLFPSLATFAPTIFQWIVASILQAWNKSQYLGLCQVEPQEEQLK